MNPPHHGVQSKPAGVASRRQVNATGPGPGLKFFRRKNPLLFFNTQGGNAERAVIDRPYNKRLDSEEWAV